MIRNSIQNFLTLLNLVCGCIAVFFAGQGKLEWAGLAIFAAAVFDFSDGFIARLLNAQSELGKQLDSLADVISFGVAPGLIMYQLLLLGNRA